MVPILYHNRLVVASEVRSSRWCYDRTFNLVSTRQLRSKRISTPRIQDQSSFTLVQNHFPNPVAANDPQDTGIGNRSEVFKVHTFQGASGTLVDEPRNL